MVYSMNWYDNLPYQDKEKDLINKIKRLSKKYSKISLIGLSAGGSVVFNLMTLLPNTIYKSISVCGRLRSGKQIGFRSFKFRTRSSRKFVESVLQFSQKEKFLTTSQKKRMMTINPLFGDELVPRNTCLLNQSKNIFLPTISHSLTIICSLISRSIKKFLLN